jgi:hypothetical protein
MGVERKTCTVALACPECGGLVEFIVAAVTSEFGGITRHYISEINRDCGCVPDDGNAAMEEQIKFAIARAKDSGL